MQRLLCLFLWFWVMTFDGRSIFWMMTLIDQNLVLAREGQGEHSSPCVSFVWANHHDISTSIECFVCVVWYETGNLMQQRAINYMKRLHTWTTAESPSWASLVRTLLISCTESNELLIKCFHKVYVFCPLKSNTDIMFSLEQLQNCLSCK